MKLVNKVIKNLCCKSFVAILTTGTIAVVFYIPFGFKIRADSGSIQICCSRPSP